MWGSSPHCRVTGTSRGKRRDPESNELTFHRTFTPRFPSWRVSGDGEGSFFRGLVTVPRPTPESGET